MQLEVIDKLLHMNAVKMQLNKINRYCTKHLAKYSKNLRPSFSSSLPLTHRPFPKNWLGAPTASFKENVTCLQKVGNRNRGLPTRGPSRSSVPKRYRQEDSAEAAAVQSKRMVCSSTAGHTGLKNLDTVCWGRQSWCLSGELLECTSSPTSPLFQLLLDRATL